MRIAIDATLLKEGVLTGVERYTIALIRSLVQAPIRDEIFVLCNGQVHSSLKNLLPQFTPIVCSLSHPTLRFFRDQFWIPMVLSHIKADIVHFPFCPPPILCPTKVVLTIHDAGLYLFPHLMAPIINYYHKPLIRFGLLRGVIKRIVTTSQSAQADLRRILLVPKEMICATYQGIDDTLQGIVTPSDTARVREQYGLNTPYILTIGAYMPLKNIPMLINAFSYLKRHYKHYKLVIVGRRGWDHRIPVDNPPPGVIFTGYVRDDDLKALLVEAEIFVFPSLYEGFGLPVLEAMHYGVPIVCSDISVLREVAGNQAAEFANPLDPQDFAAKLANVLENQSLRQKLIAAGKERAASFVGHRDFGLFMRNVYQEAINDK